jgi:hypothetical protein
MMQLIEWKHYRQRETQPSPAPHKSKEAVDYILCSDPSATIDAQSENFRKKRSRPIGLNNRLDWLHAHLKMHHPDVCREGGKSLFAMGFTRRAVGAEDTAPDAHVPVATWHDLGVEAYTSLGIVS